MESKKLLLSFILLLMLLFVFLGLIECKNNCKTEPVEVGKEIQIEQKEEVEEVPEEVVTSTEPKEEPTKIEYRVTAYCPCEKCCGKWAKNRPLNELGEPIVYGASGKTLLSGVSCASPLEFDTQIELDGIGIVEVQDRTANWVVNKYGENVIDIYMSDHETAKNFGVKYIEGVIK